MHLRRGPFRWPCWCAGAIRSTSPDVAWPGLYQKPLDAAIGQLLTPYRPGGRQGDNHYEHVPTLLAISMAIAMRRCYTPRIARWRRFVAFIKATKRHHRASTCSDRHQSDMPTLGILVKTSWKRAPVDMLAPNNNRSMTYQTDEKYLNYMVKYSVEVVKLAHYCYYITRFLLHVINQLSP